MKYGHRFPCALVAALLAACGPAAPRGPAPEAVSIYGSYGFQSGTPGFDDCVAKLDPLARVGETNRARCEAMRQQAPAMTPTGGYPGGFGSSVVQNDAAYRLCLTERAPPPVQMDVPGGRRVTCQLVETHLQCY